MICSGPELEVNEEEGRRSLIFIYWPCHKTADNQYFFTCEIVITFVRSIGNYELLTS